MVDESDEANKTTSITVSYSNDTHTDSPIIKVNPVTPPANSETATGVNQVQLTSDAINSESTSTTIVPAVVESSTAETNSTNSTKEEDKDKSEEDEEEHSLNLFGEDVEDSSSTEMSDNATESTTPESNIQILTTTHLEVSTESVNQKVGESNETVTEKPASSDTAAVVLLATEQPQYASSVEPLTTSQVPSQSIQEVVVSTTAQTLESPDSSTKLEQSTIDSMTMTPESVVTASTYPPFTLDTSTSVTVNVLENVGDEKSRITLDSFKRFDESEDNTLKVIPLSHKEYMTTTENIQQTSENEITERTETTGHFLEQTTFPSIKSESDETSNFRNGRIIPESVFKNGTEQKSSQSLDDDNLDKTKLFKQEFLDKLNISVAQPICSEDQFKCAFSNECISKGKICDGKAQCADYSDEWSCFDLSTMKVLQVKREEKLFKVCASKWSKELSDKVCNKLGFFGAAEWKSSKDEMNKDEKYLIARSGALEGFESADSCDDGLVEIQCADYGKYYAIFTQYLN